MIERALLRTAYVVAGIVSLLWLTAAQASEPVYPALTGRVVDEAGVLSEQTKDQLTQILAGDEQHYGGRQVVVVTLKSLQGYSIEEFGVDLGRHWAIGQKGKDDGVLVLVAPNEHKARIEVAYGNEGVLTDAQSRVILDRTMLPQFRKGDYDSGVLAGTEAVLATLGNTSYAAPDYTRTDDNRGGIPRGLIVLGFIIFILVFHGGRMFWPMLFLGGMGGRSGWGGGSFGGGGFGGGGFSGGGGSFGGGGASGSW
jgi:uncharacterized protein